MLEQKNKLINMAVNLPFEEGDWVDSQTWSEAFKVSPYKGISPSNENKLIVCISVAEGDGVPYQDKWYYRPEWDGVGYTGEGLRDHQTLTTPGNKRLEKDKSAYFFRKKRGENKYLYCGKFIMVEEPGNRNPRVEQQPDVDGKMRNVWIFNMKYAKGHYPEKLALEMQAFEE